MNDDKWDIYKDGADEWRWTRTASNGEVVGSSHEGYKNWMDCINNAKRHGYAGSAADINSKENN